MFLNFPFPLRISVTGHLSNPRARFETEKGSDKVESYEKQTQIQRHTGGKDVDKNIVGGILDMQHILFQCVNTLLRLTLIPTLQSTKYEKSFLSF